ncbi:MAG TPA: 50S ribosomal protein L11 methyltransferase [Verrucomicrobiae bacterium]|nr:50S ribosomal protein L11 methyltransferase [Verrucomicrobiae bacterium]
MIPPRLWQVSVRTTAEGEEAVADLLERVLGQPPAVYRSEETGEVVVTVYPEELPASQSALRASLKAALEEMRGTRLDLGAAGLAIKRLARENWAESWKRHFQPIEIGHRLLIKPSWSRRRARPGQRVVILDPGLSFGTGQHATTLFCLQQLARCRRRGVAQAMLDVGCGSGILAIAAAKLGYHPVLAFDNDPEAVRASRYNIRRNNVRVAVRRADLTRLPQAPRRRYDVICANLICDMLASEAERIRGWLKPGGKLVAAGILNREFFELQKKLRRCRLTLEKSGVKENWKSGQFVLL